MKKTIWESLLRESVGMGSILLIIVFSISLGQLVGSDCNDDFLCKDYVAITICIVAAFGTMIYAKPWLSVPSQNIRVALTLYAMLLTLNTVLVYYLPTSWWLWSFFWILINLSFWAYFWFKYLWPAWLSIQEKE